MVKIKIDKNICDLNIGVLGSRANILIKLLENYPINKHTELRSALDITSKYDLIFVTGYYKIISKDIISKIKYGIYCFHETPLPKGRGHAPLQWTILNNKKNLTITLFKIDDGIDTGMIADQCKIPISKLDTYEILEKKRTIGIIKCFQTFLKKISKKTITLRKQNGKPSFQERRIPDDSELSDKIYTIEKLWDKLRICDNKEFPAFIKIEDKKIILRYEVINNDSK